MVRRSGSRLGPGFSRRLLQPTCFQEGFGPESSAPTLPEKHSVGPTESQLLLLVPPRTKDDSGPKARLKARSPAGLPAHRAYTISTGR